MNSCSPIGEYSPRRKNRHTETTLSTSCLFNPCVDMSHNPEMHGTSEFAAKEVPCADPGRANPGCARKTARHIRSRRQAKTGPKSLEVLELRDRTTVIKVENTAGQVE